MAASGVGAGEQMPQPQGRRQEPQTRSFRTCSGSPHDAFGRPAGGSPYKNCHACPLTLATDCIAASAAGTSRSQISAPPSRVPYAEATPPVSEGVRRKPSRDLILAQGFATLGPQFPVARTRGVAELLQIGLTGRRSGPRAKGEPRREATRPRSRDGLSSGRPVSRPPARRTLRCCISAGSENCRRR